jgi:hypothetical protein
MGADFAREGALPAAAESCLAARGGGRRLGRASFGEAQQARLAEMENQAIPTTSSNWESQLEMTNPVLCGL